MLVASGPDANGAYLVSSVEVTTDARTSAQDTILNELDSYTPQELQEEIDDLNAKIADRRAKLTAIQSAQNGISVADQIAAADPK